jgi:hypothetical protein
MSDELDRDKIYADDGDADDGVEDDGVEYEVEPPDPDVLTAEERHAERMAGVVKKAIDIDEIYRDLENSRDTEILRQIVESVHFQFQVKHLLIVTALAAIVLTLAKFDLLVHSFIWVVMVGVIGVTLYLQWEERKRQAEADRRRQAIYAQRRAELKMANAASPAVRVDASAKPAAAGPEIEEFEAVRQRAARRGFRFRFSLWQLLVVITGAAILLGLANLLGGAQYAASLLGMLALVGLVIHALGYEPPDIVAFSWWVLLLVYIVFSILTAVWVAATA